MTQRNNKRQSPTKVKFRIGGPDDTIYLLHQRGDTSQTISERFGLRVEEVEAAIERCRARKRRESGETFHERTREGSGADATAASDHTALRPCPRPDGMFGNSKIKI
jgi:hypothetical protein